MKPIWNNGKSDRSQEVTPIDPRRVVDPQAAAAEFDDEREILPEGGPLCLCGHRRHYHMRAGRSCESCPCAGFRTIEILEHEGRLTAAIVFVWLITFGAAIYAFVLTEVVRGR